MSGDEEKETKDEVTNKKTKLSHYGEGTLGVGTDLWKDAEQVSSGLLSWQRARPWYMSDSEGSNLAKDNELTVKDHLFKPSTTVAVFGVPAPFTGTCANEHYPPYKQKAREFKEAGCDRLICFSVADPYSHHAWAKNLQNNFDEIEFCADPDGTWTKHYGLQRDYEVASLGHHRSARFSMLVKDGQVKAFHIVENDVTKDADVLLADARALQEGQEKPEENKET